MSFLTLRRGRPTPVFLTQIDARGQATTGKRKVRLQNAKTLRMVSLKTTLCLSALILSTSCATVARGPDIEPLLNQPVESTPFMAVGTITVQGGGTGFSGWAHLSMDGDKFRLEALDSMNRAVFALAGDPDSMTSVDPATGERRRVNAFDPIAPELGGVAPPPALLRSAVTGETPRFGGIVSTNRFFGKNRVVTENPSMELLFDGRLVEARMRMENGGMVTLRLGPVAEGVEPKRLEWAEISFGSGATLMVRWKKMEPVQGFPDGFFAFSEPEDDF